MLLTGIPRFSMFLTGTLLGFSCFDWHCQVFHAFDWYSARFLMFLTGIARFSMLLTGTLPGFSCF